MSNKLRPVLLAGGSGKRLWPLSTEERPKQFIPLFKNFSLFDLSLQRFNNSSLFKKPIIVTSEKYLGLVNTSISRTGVNVKKIILEPEPKNTAPAIALAVQLALKENSDEDFFVAPSDHYIAMNKNFYEACFLSKDKLKLGGLLLMGIKPDRPSTEYGYISAERSSKKIKKVLSFVEKPNLKKSKELISQPNVYWNGGMFAFNGSWLLNEMKVLNGNLTDLIANLVKLPSDDSKYFRPDPGQYEMLESISFDKLFVEKIDNISMTSLEAGWSDLGSWVSLGEAQRDPNIKITLYSQGLHERVEKPWGFFENLMETESSKVKLLSVSSGEKLSLQRHEHRIETWHIIKGKAKVIRGNERLNLQVGDSITIEKNQLHRLENSFSENLEVIEIQTGSYFGEDDIIRLADKYGRVKKH